MGGVGREVQDAQDAGPPGKPEARSTAAGPDSWGKSSPQHPSVRRDLGGWPTAAKAKGTHENLELGISGLCSGIAPMACVQPSLELPFLQRTLVLV